MASDRSREIQQSVKAVMEANRKKLSFEERQVLALERIADQLQKISAILTQKPR